MPEANPSRRKCCDTPDAPAVQHPHESPLIMTLPLIILAILAIIGGYIGIPLALNGANRIEQFMQPVFTKTVVHEQCSLTGECSEVSEIVESVSPPSEEPGTEILLMVISVLMSLIGIGAAYYLYVKKPHLPGQIAARLSLVYKVVFNKYYIDEIYQKVVVNNLLRLNDFLGLAH